MLGGSEDLAAVQGVLDRLSNELHSNRLALNSTCEKADEISGESALSDNFASDLSVEDLQQKIKEESRDCDYLRESLESALQLSAKAAQMMRAVSEARAEEEIKAHAKASRDLLDWQTEVQNVADEYQSLETQRFNVNRQLAKLYEKLQST